MSIYEHLWYIVETESLFSTNSRIAQYILLNYKNIENTRLDDIAYGSNVVKSTVSKFFKGITENGSYDSFLAAIASEKKDMNIAKKQTKKEQNSLSCKDVELQFLVNSIQNSSKVIFFTNESCMTCIRKFCEKLIDERIIGKIAPYFYKNTIKDEILSLNENDCVIFVDLEKSFYEHILRLGFEIDFFSLISKCKCQIINLSSTDEKVSGVRTIVLDNKSHISGSSYLDDILNYVLQNMR